MARKLGAESSEQISGNRTIQLWSQLPEDALGTLSCKPSSFKKRVRKEINKAK
jgi:hypothetical protein